MIGEGAEEAIAVAQRRGSVEAKSTQLLVQILSVLCGIRESLGQKLGETGREDKRIRRTLPLLLVVRERTRDVG